MIGFEFESVNIHWSVTNSVMEVEAVEGCGTWHVLLGALVRLTSVLPT